MHLTPRLEAYATWIVAHRSWVLGALLLITAALGVGVSRVRFEVDPDSELPQRHPYVATFQEVHRLFGDKNLLVIGLLPNDTNAFSPHFLAKVREISDAIAALPGAVPALVQSVASPFTKTIEASPGGLRVDALISPGPLDSERSATLKKRVLGNPLFMGTLVSYDKSALAIYATFELTPRLPGYVNIYKAATDILARADDGTFTYLISGPIAVVASLSTYARQVGKFFILAILIIGFVHFEAFRSWQAVVLPLLTGLLAVLWALGSMGYCGVAVDPLNSTTPVLILAVGAGHAVQILKRYYEEVEHFDDPHRAIVVSLGQVGGVMIAAGSIAALSFLSLASLGTDSMRAFGVFTALGIAAALVLELSLIPALRACISEPQSKLPQHRGAAVWIERSLVALGRQLANPTMSRRLLLIYCVIVVICVALSSRVDIDTSFRRNFAADAPVRLTDERLNQLFAGTNTIILMVQGSGENSIAQPAVLRGMNSLERRVEELPRVGKALSVVDTLKEIHQAIAGKDHVDAVPETASLALQYLFLYTLAGGNDLSSQITPDNRTAKITILLHDDSTKHGETLIAQILQIAHEELPANISIRVAGSIAADSALTQTMVRGKLINILQIAVITIAVSALVFRSILAALLVALPLTIAVTINFGVMGAVGLNLDVATAAVAAMAVGIGADYAVYFLFRVREEYRLTCDVRMALASSFATSGSAIVFVSTAVALGYAVLCLSGFRLFVELGGLVGLSMVTSSVATLSAVPAILVLLTDSDWGWSIVGGRLDRPHANEVDIGPRHIAGG